MSDEPKKSQFIDAKELSGIVELHERHVRRARVQRRLGIAGFRDRTCDRPIRWHRERTLDLLRQRGFTVD